MTPKVRQHLLQVVALVEVAEHQHLQQPSRTAARPAAPAATAGEETPGEAVEHHRQVGAQHVLHAVGEVDEIHHPEHQREPGRHEEQQDAELQPVEQLDDEQRGGHREIARQRGQAWRRCIPDRLRNSLLDDLPRSRGRV